VTDEDRVTLKAYIDTRFTAADRAADARFEAMQTAIATLERSHQNTMQTMDKAVQKAEAAADRRFESVNEFRKTLGDQQSTFLTRNEFAVEHKSLTQRFDSLDRELRSRLDTASGSAKGIATFWGLLISLVVAVGAAATAIGFVLELRK